MHARSRSLHTRLCTRCFLPAKTSLTISSSLCMSPDTPGMPSMASHSASRSRDTPCEVSLTTLVLGEISQVTSMMRKNARWATSSSLTHNGAGIHVSAMSAGLLAADDDKAGLAKELGLRGSKSRDRLKAETTASNALKPSSSRDRGSATSMNKPAASLLSGFAALRNDLTDVEGNCIVVSLYKPTND